MAHLSPLIRKIAFLCTMFSSVTGIAAWAQLNYYTRDVSPNPATPPSCPTVHTVSACLSDAQQEQLETIRANPGNGASAGPLYDFDHSLAVTGANKYRYSTDGFSFKTPGDALSPIPGMTLQLRNSHILPTVGMTVAFTYYLRPASAAVVATDSALVSFYATGGVPVGVLSFDGTHFKFTKRINDTTSDINAKAFTQTF